MIITMKKTFDQDANDHNDINDYPITHRWIKVVVYNSSTQIDEVMLKPWFRTSWLTLSCNMKPVSEETQFPPFGKGNMQTLPLE